MRQKFDQSQKGTCNWDLTRLVVHFDLAIRAAFLVGRVEQDKRRVVTATAFWFIWTAAETWASGIGVVLRVPHFAAIVGRPEHVVLFIEDVLGADVLLGEHGVTLAQRSITGAGSILAEWRAVLVAVAVLDELANAHFAVSHASAFDTVLVRFADSVQSVNWWTVTGIGHWAIAENKTIATVRPVLALVKTGIVMLHHIDQL